MSAFIRKLKEYNLHHAPKSITYWKIAQDSSIEERTEVDLVPLARGVDIPGHIHERSNALVLILSGSGTVTLGEQEQNIEKFDVINIPAGTYHAFQSSQQEELTFLSVQYPPISGDYVFAKIAPQRIQQKITPSVLKRLLPYAIAASVCISFYANVTSHNENRTLREENETQKIVTQVSSNPYLQHMELGMSKYHRDAQTTATQLKITIEEFVSKSPYPLI